MKSQVRLRCEIKRKLFNSTSKACLFEMVPAGSMIYQSLMTAKGAAGGVQQGTMNGVGKARLNIKEKDRTDKSCDLSGVLEEGSLHKRETITYYFPHKVPLPSIFRLVKISKYVIIAMLSLFCQSLAFILIIIYDLYLINTIQ